MSVGENKERDKIARGDLIARRVILHESKYIRKTISKTEIKNKLIKNHKINRLKVRVRGNSDSKKNNYNIK